MTAFIWIDEPEAIAMHDHSIDAHGGAPGLRDANLLRSALARPQQYIAYATAFDPAKLAAIYTSGIVKNHPFIDGNKRTGFMVGVLFLELNGYSFTAKEEDAANAVLSLASGLMDENGYQAFLAANITSHEA